MTEHPTGSRLVVPDDPTPHPTPTLHPAPAPYGTTARVGMVGGGQLARMTQRAAIDLAIHLEVLAASPDDPAVLAGAPHLLGRPDDLAALTSLAERVEVVTLDHELVPGEHLRALERAGHRVFPPPQVLLLAQDKLHARRELAALGFPVPAFAAVDELADVERFAAEHGWPVVMKSARGGYDGRGVRVVDDAAEAADALAAGGSWLVEERVPLAMELAVVTARRPSGDHVVYPVVETVQREGICVELVMPARVEAAIGDAAVALAGRLVDTIGAVGIVAVELFVTPDGELIVNELAMRPHNSGHASIEGSTTSQFHNHLRAVLDWPLGSTQMRAPVAAMVNLLGGEAATDLGARLPQALAVPGAHVHLYGKAVRPGRKIGHVTVLGDDPATALAAAREAADRLVAP
jgi:5-(carboxyamino)imidazole ribonucleotide synthase